MTANTAIRAAVLALGQELRLPVHIPPFQYCTDNGAMIAGMGSLLLSRQKTSDLRLDTVATV